MTQLRWLASSGARQGQERPPFPDKIVSASAHTHTRIFKFFPYDTHTSDVHREYDHKNNHQATSISKTNKTNITNDKRWINTRVCVCVCAHSR